MKNQIQVLMATLLTTTSVWAANTKVSIASQAPQWSIVQAEIALACTNERVRYGQDQNAFLARRGEIEIQLRDNFGNPRFIKLPLIANIYASDGSSLSDGVTSYAEKDKQDQCMKQSGHRRYIDGLSGKPLKSVYGEYKGGSGGLTSSSHWFANVTNQHGISILDIEGERGATHFAYSNTGWADVTIFVAPPSEGGAVNIDGIDTNDIGAQQLNVSLEELMEMKIGTGAE